MNRFFGGFLELVGASDGGAAGVCRRNLRGLADRPGQCFGRWLLWHSLLADDELRHPASGIRRRIAVREPSWTLLALSVLGCGPSRAAEGGTSDGATGSEGSGAVTSAASSGTATGVDTATSTGSSSAASDADESSETTASLECAQSDAVSPFCYRRFPIDWAGDPGSWSGVSRVGRFGPDGELAYLLAGGAVGDPMGLASWNGDGFVVRSWGTVPSSRVASRVPIRMFSAEHSDLLLTDGQDPDIRLRIARWGLDGPLDEIAVEPTMSGVVGPALLTMPIVDLDGDGLQEFASSNDANPLSRVIVRNVDGVPTYTTELAPYTCGNTLSGIGAGDLDADGFGDFAVIGDCELDEKPGAIFWFAALWGSGGGGFEQSAVEFRAEGRGGWLGIGDFDGDGFDDVALMLGDGDSEPQQLHLEVHRSRGDRSFDPPRRVWSQGYPPGSTQPPSEGVGPSDASFAIGDVDGDGADDIVFANVLYALIDVLGRPEPLPMLSVWAWLDEDAIPAADFNGDGRLDFVLYRESGLIEGLVSTD